MHVQLVHESVLTVDHYASNTERGITTVMLTPVESREDAVLKLRSFSDRVRQKYPASTPDLSVYCCGSEPIRACCKLHSHVTRLIQESGSVPKIIEHHKDWQ